MKISRTNPIDEAVYQLFINRDRLELMQRAMDCLAKPNSAVDLVNFVKKTVEERAR